VTFSIVGFISTDILPESNSIDVNYILSGNCAVAVPLESVYNFVLCINIINLFFLGYTDSIGSIPGGICVLFVLYQLGNLPISYISGYITPDSILLNTLSTLR